MSASAPTATAIMDNIPEEYICPISYEIMKDPVIASDGQTYDRDALLQWLQVRSISPLTNEPITAASLVRNYALNAAIQRFVATSAAATGGARAPAAPQPTAVKKNFRVSVNRAAKIGRITCDHDVPMETIVILNKDNSGSMAGSAARERSKEGGDFSRLDLVKHAARTVATMLAERNAAAPTYLALQTFSSNAKVVMPLRPMTQENLTASISAIDGIGVDGMTNLWDGLRLSLDTAVRAARLHPGANIHIMLLTDGEPTQSCDPPQGIRNALERKLKAITSMGASVTLSAFGFGYQLDSYLLRNIAEQGGGTFGYIPDCSMVGTVFINTVATILSTVARNVSIEDESGAFIQLPGVLTAGQTRFFPVRADLSKRVVKYDGSQELSVDVEDDTQSATFERGVILLSEILARFLNGGAEKQWLIDTGMQLYDDLGKEAAAAIADGDPKTAAKLSALRDDISSREAHAGQIMKALSRDDWLAEWGVNHFIGYLRALVTQQCCNFKDATPQLFMGSLNRELREMGNTIFDNLPAPKPSLANYGGSYYGGGGGGAAAPVNMAIFNNANGGCWTGRCKIRLADDDWCYASEISPGDYVWGDHRVLCVIRTEYKEPIQLCKFGDALDITPWHPVRRVNDPEQRWRFPADLVTSTGETGTAGATSREMVHYTYNMVLESGHIVQIGDYEVCTLGHFIEGEVIGHEYFGTHRVLEDLQAQPGWDRGYITITPKQWVRDENGLVCGLRNGGGYGGGAAGLAAGAAANNW